MAKGKKQTSQSKQSKAHSPKENSIKNEDFTFGKQSYRLLFVGLALIALGFILMAGGGSNDPNVFNEEIFSHRRITVAPLLILAGYVVEIFAIMKKPKSKNEE
jgi:hypothetical protein